MTTITNKASSMTKAMKPRVQNYQMTREYVELGQDGINTMLGEYSVVFEDTSANIETLDSTLTALNGTTTFLWNPYITFLPLSVAKTFVCEEWEKSEDTTGKATLSATFKEQPTIQGGL